MTQPDLSAPVVLLRRNFFWRLHLVGNTATVNLGRGGSQAAAASAGRHIQKSFSDAAVAQQWCADAVRAKLGDGYTNVSPDGIDDSADDMEKDGDHAPENATIASVQAMAHGNAGSDANNNIAAPVAPPPTAGAPRRSLRKRAQTKQLGFEPEPPAALAPVVPSSAAAPRPAVKRMKRGLKGAAAVATTAPLGVVDPASNLTGTILVVDADGPNAPVVYDVMLVLVDLAKRHDKFIVLQLINATDGGFTLYQRWGRTGTSGQCLTKRFVAGLAAHEDAVLAFEEKFLEKTGLQWHQRFQHSLPGYYRFVVQDFSTKPGYVASGARWQYWVDDFVDGKPVGWYDYDASGTALVEQLLFEKECNPWLSQRIVKSGMYTYLVDLDLGQQTNIEHQEHKVRCIRRVAPGIVPDDVPPSITAVDDPEVFKSDVEMEEDDGEDGHLADREMTELPVESKPSVKKPKPEHAVTPAPPAIVPGSGTKTVAAQNGTAITQRTATVKAEPKEDPQEDAQVEAQDKAKAKSRGKAKSRNKAKATTKTAPKSTAGLKKEPEPETIVEAQVAKVVIPVDDSFPNAKNYTVVDNFDATLNQTNIMGGNNNNKYYRIQLLSNDKQTAFYVWTRWGRVGEVRGTQTSRFGPFKDVATAEKVFAKKFKDKTGNVWAQRDAFKPKTGKYDLVEVDYSAEEGGDGKDEPIIISYKAKEQRAKKVEYLPSKLGKVTQELIELLFQKDMYMDAMREFDIDIRKMPLGKLSIEQIQKGAEVLGELEEAVKAHALPARLEALSSKFYTTLPHDFGRRRPPVIATEQQVRRCFDMCNVLTDMQQASTLMDKAEEKQGVREVEAVEKVAPPADEQYDSLNAELCVVEPGSDEFETVTKAFQTTKGSHSKSRILTIWRVERDGERARFSVYPKENHKLLWHGSHIGSIAAILATGLRIMPHSGGRCGRGIYLASENYKSQGYTHPAEQNGVACMFLAEAALGKEFKLLNDDCSLVKAPEGFDSVHACGQQTPASVRRIVLDGVDVSVPVDAPERQTASAGSSFFQDEYLVYREGQCRIRYVISLKMY